VVVNYCCRNKVTAQKAVGAIANVRFQKRYGIVPEQTKQWVGHVRAEQLHLGETEGERNPKQRYG